MVPVRAKHALFALVMLLAIVLAVELPAAWLHWASTRPRGTPFVTVHLVRQGLAGLGRRRVVERSSDPSPLFAADARLGYTILPNRYRVRLTEGGRVLEFTATVEPDTTRATGPRAGAGARDDRSAILVFGDSYTWGWGVDDESSFPWIVQSALPGRRVVNLAQNGYGHLHMLQQMEDRRAAVESADAVVVAYADFLEPRNLPAPARLREFRILRDAWGRVALPDAFHPTARLRDDGSLERGRVPMGCEGNAWCDQPEPSRELLERLTTRLLAEMRTVRGARPIVLAWLAGDDASPVVASARAAGWQVCDMRPRRGFHEWQDLAPFDPHPGPLAQAKYARKLVACLTQEAASG